MSSRKELEQACRHWFEAVNQRDADTLSALVADTVTYENKQVAGREYVRQLLDVLESASAEKVELDMITIDKTTRGVAARLIIQGTLKKPYLGAQVTGNPIEWVEYPLIWFDASHKIVRYLVLTDTEVLRSNTARVARTPTFHYAPAPSPDFDLKTMYEGYLHTVNNAETAARENLYKYAQSRVTHNLQDATLDEFRGFLEANAGVVDDLRLTVTELIVDEETQQIASRIVLTGTPKEEFMGVQPTGRAMRFPEHAMYKLDGGKIAYVWAVRDADTLKESLKG